MHSIYLNSFTHFTTHSICSCVMHGLIGKLNSLSANISVLIAALTALGAAVKNRKGDLEYMTTDQANFIAQCDLAGGKKTMKAYLWKICGDIYDTEHPRA